MYQLGEVIGRGVTGVVHRTVDPLTGHELAVKVLHPHLVGDIKATSRFIQERHALSRVTHPNVVQVVELVMDRNQLSIVMELVEGGDLKRLHQRLKPRPSEAVSIVARIADALAALHGAGVVHRDLKPANVLIEHTAEGPVPKITDFGLSRLVEEGMSQSSAAVGTPLYMAPEAIERASTTGPPADVYALGIMLYELLIGTPPFVGGGTLAILNAHSREVPPLLDGVPPELRALVREMLAKDPTVRPGAADVRDRLGALIGRIDDRSVPVAAVDQGSESETVPRVRSAVGVGAPASPARPGPADGLGGNNPGRRDPLLPGDEQLTVAGPTFPSARVALPEPGLAASFATRRMVVAGLVALAGLLILSGLMVVRARRDGDQVEAGLEPASYAFDPERLEGGGQVTRQWTLSTDGGRLEGELTVTNDSDGPLEAEYVEVLPSTLGVEIGEVRFDPDPIEQLEADRAAVLRVLLPDPAGSATIRYSVAIGPGDGSMERLASLAADQQAAQKAFYANKANAHRLEPEPIAVDQLEASPRSLNLRVGDPEREVVLAGSLAGGASAPSDVLAVAVWSSSNPAVAIVDNGRVQAAGPGDATITAQIGDTAVKVPVAVVGPDVVAGPARSVDDLGGSTTTAGVGAVVTAAPVQTTLPPSTTTSTVTVPALRKPGAPVGITVNKRFRDPGNVDVAWSPPTDNGGSPIVEYQVRVAGSAQTQSIDDTSATLKVVPGTTIRVEVQARNGVDWGPLGRSAEFATAQAPGSPGTPKPVAGGVTESSAEVTFTSASCTTAKYVIDNAAVGWESQYWPEAWKEGVGRSCWFNHGHTFSGLKPGTTYKVSVILMDTAGVQYDGGSVSFITKALVTANVIAGPEPAALGSTTTARRGSASTGG